MFSVFVIFFYSANLSKHEAKSRQNYCYSTAGNLFRDNYHFGFCNTVQTNVLLHIVLNTRPPVTNAQFSLFLKVYNRFMRVQSFRLSAV